MCVQTALESVNGLGTLDGDAECVPQKGRRAQSNAYQNIFQEIARCRYEIFTIKF